MRLDFLNNLERNLESDKSNSFITEFIADLKDYINNSKEINSGIRKNNNLRQEDCLYQVVDFSIDGVYLQNTNNNIIFEEVNIPDELKNVISNDYILRYKNGKYVFEEELTDEFFKNMVDINKYKEIQEKFIKRTNILKIDSKMRYSVLSRDKDFTRLKYKYGEIEVPNILLPYFIKKESILYFKNGKFHKDLLN